MPSGQDPETAISFLKNKLLKPNIERERKMAMPNDPLHGAAMILEVRLCCCDCSIILIMLYRLQYCAW